MNLKKRDLSIATILPYKENYTEDLASAASLWVKEYYKNSKYNKNNFIFGHTKSKNYLTKNYRNIQLYNLKSRIKSFIFLGIELPTDDLLKVIISKTLSDKQISINPRISNYIINNVDRSYEKMFKFLKDIDDLSLSTGKSININLIKKVLDQ